MADRERLTDLNPERRELILRPQARQHQQHRRLVGAGGEDHLALGADELDPAVPDDLNADSAVAFEHDPERHRAGPHREVRASDGGSQVAIGGGSTAGRRAA